MKRKVLKERKKANVTSDFKNGKKRRWKTRSWSASPESLEVVEQIDLEATSRHVKVKQAVRSSHHRIITLDQPGSLL